MFFASGHETNLERFFNCIHIAAQLSNGSLHVATHLNRLSRFSYQKTKSISYIKSDLKLKFIRFGFKVKVVPRLKISSAPSPI